MSGTVVGGVYYNTDSGLTPMLDRVTGMLDKDRQQRDQLAGIAPALAATGVNLPQQPQGMFGGVLSALGIGGGQQQPLPSPQGAQTAGSAAAPADQPPSMIAAPPSADRQSFIQAMAPHALAIAQQTGIDPRIVIAQSALETGFGQHAPGNNFFGIKGQGQNLATNEVVDGKNTPTMASFAAYPDMASSAQAYADFINKNPRYAELKSAQGLGPQIEALGRSGYATDPNYATKVGLLAGSIPQSALAFAGQGGATTPGSNDAGADVAAAGLAARTAAGYGPPPGVSTGAQTAAATGAAPMPIASASPSVAPTMQTGRAPGAAPAPALGSAAGISRAPLGGITNEALGAMIANPESRDLGLKLWQQKLGKGDFGFSVTPDGTVIRTDKETGQAVPVYQAPVKQGFQELNGRLLATDPLSGSARDATPAGIPQGYRPATPQERAAYGVQPGAPLFFGPDNKPATLNSGTNVTVNNATNPILSGLGKQFVDGRAEADSAAKSLPMIRTAKTQLQNGIIAGAGANQVLALQKLGVALGLPGTDASKIVNTETFSASVKPLVMQLVKNLGSGNGITDADVRFVNEAVGGEKTLEPQSLARILDITERAARTKVTDYNSLADEMLKTPGGEAYKLIAPMMHVSMPPAAASTGGSKTIGGVTYHQGPDGHWYQ